MHIRTYMHGLCSLVLVCLLLMIELAALLLYVQYIALHFRRRNGRVMARMTLLYYHCLDRVWTHLYNKIYLYISRPQPARGHRALLAACQLHLGTSFTLTVTGLMFCCLLIDHQSGKRSTSVKSQWPAATVYATRTVLNYRSF